MKIRTLFGLAALGGLYYAHRRRGGTLSIDSIKDSLQALRKKAMSFRDDIEAQVPPNGVTSKPQAGSSLDDNLH